MKIILTHGYFIDEDPKEREIMRPYPPLGILYVSAWLEKFGFDNSVFDSTFSTFDKLEADILVQKPDVLAIYTNLMTKVNVVKLLAFVRQNDSLSHCKLILGGPEVRNHAERFLKAGADVLVLGEGEQTMLELVEHFDQGKSINDIQGTALFDADGKVQINPERPQLRDLSELPLPNRTKIDLQLYFDAWKQKHGTSAISINTMRGCPYTCKWCSRAVYGLSYRRRSAKEVADEIEWIQNTYNVDTAWFVDDVFTVNHKWLREFNDELKSRNLKLPYECITRADRMTEEVIDLLKESGCFRVWIGAESGSQRVIDLMDRRVDVQKVRDMIVLAQQKGIQAGTFIMVGYPGETEADIFETVHHLKSSNPDIFTITVAYPIKGTELYAEVEADFTKSLDWATSTDRDIDFKRTYSRKYYDYAVRMIVNDVNSFKASLSKEYYRFLKFKTKAVAARVAMRLSR
jgi:anaerobic magnesium-protoporphyrin IX monomethyl ester cyclase